MNEAFQHSENKCKFFVELVNLEDNRSDNYWLVLNDIWLTISKKINSNYFYKFPIFLSEVRICNDNDTYSNGVYFETDRSIKKNKFVIKTLNRKDMLCIYQMFEYMHKNFKSVFRTNENIRLEKTITVEETGKLFGIGKEKYNLTLTEDTIILENSKNVKKIIPLNKINYISFNLDDSNNLERFIICFADENSNLVEKKLKSDDEVSINNLITSFIYYKISILKVDSTQNCGMPISS